MHNLTIGATNAAINQHLVTFAPQVKQVFRTGLEFESMLPFVSADEVYTASNVSLGDIVQPYQPRFTPNNVENWDAVSNTLRPIKIDLEFTEEQLQKFYDKWKNMWFEAGKDPLEWSYPRYIIEQVVAPKYREEINRAEWLGEYVAPTLGTPGASLESLDGFKITIENAITAGKLTPVASGSYTSSDIRQKIEDWMMAMPTAVRGRAGTIMMSDSWARKYYFDFRGDFNTATWASLEAAGMGLMVDGFPVRVKGIRAMEGSNRWIYLPDGEQNMILGTRNGYPRDPQFIFDTDLYSLKAKAVIYRFCGFEFWDNLYVNDQA